MSDESAAIEPPPEPMSEGSAAIEIRLLAPGDEGLLERASDDVFDHAPKPEAVAEFLRDPRHHVVVALEDGEVVGFASGVHYVHPDKDPELWIAEVGVVPDGAHVDEDVVLYSWRLDER